MMYLKFRGSDNKIVPMLIHQQIYKGHVIDGGTVEIFFESTPAVKKDKNAITYPWSFRKSVSDILNWLDVEAWLKMAKTADISPKKKPNNNQGKLEF